MSEFLSERVAKLEREVVEAREQRDSAVRIGTQYRAWWRGAEAQVRKQVARADAAEAALATARVEGAREALGYVLRQCQLRPAVDHLVVRAIVEQKLREYPAPAAPKGEARDGCTCFTPGVPDDCVVHRRPAPTPKPEPPRHAASCASWELRNKPCDCGYATPAEPLVIPVMVEPKTFMPHVTLTPEDCRRIVALGTTQTAEG